MNTIFSKFCLIVFFKCIFFNWGFAQASKPEVYTKKISVKAMYQDLDILQENLKLVHTGLYTYHDEATLDQFFLSIKESIQAPITAIEFYRKMTTLLPVIANGHTYINPPKAYNESAHLYESVLPFLLYWDRDSLFITKNLSRNDSITARSAILSINGESPKAIIEKMMAVHTRDGYNKTMPRRNITNNFIGWYARLIGSPDTFDVELVDTLGNSKNYKIKSLYDAEIRAIFQKRYGRALSSYNNKRAAIELNISGKVATLIVRAFDISTIKKSNNQNFKSFFKDAFEKIETAGIEHLILDLRNNSGGNSKPTITLLSHLLDKEFIFYKSITAWHKKLPNPQYYVDQPVFWHNVENKLVLRKSGDIYEIKETPLTRLFGRIGLKPTKSAKTVYKGETYVLTNAGSFSATGEIIGMIKNHNLATFIGEEAGGNPNQDISGTGLTMELPNSKCLVRIPFLLYEMNVDFENTGYGIEPDYPIRNTIDDVLESRDAAMEFTLNLIEKKDKRSHSSNNSSQR